MVGQFLKILLSIIIVVDPMGQIPVFMSLTSGMDAPKRARTMWTALGAAFLILAFFIVAGAPLIAFLGISPGAFYVSGGALLFLLAVDMLYGKPRRAKNSGRDDEPGEEGSNPAIFPLAIPMISGPGAITAVMLFMSGDAPRLATGGMLLAAVFLALLAAAGAMGLSAFLSRLMGKTGVLVMEKIMGLLLAGLAVQFAYEGILRLVSGARP